MPENVEVLPPNQAPLEPPVGFATCTEKDLLAPLWTWVPPSGSLFNSVLVDEDGNLLALDRTDTRSDDRGIYHLNSVDPDGALRFRHRLPVPLGGAAFLGHVEGDVVIVAWEGEVFGYDVGDGHLRFHRKLRDDFGERFLSEAPGCGVDSVHFQITGTYRVAQGEVGVTVRIQGTYDCPVQTTGWMLRLDAQTGHGQELKQVAAGGRLAAVLDEAGRTYVSEPPQLRALDAVGSVRWATSLSGAGYTNSYQAFGGVLATGKRLYRTSDGSVLHTFEHSMGSPALSADRLFVPAATAVDCGQNSFEPMVMGFPLNPAHELWCIPLEVIPMGQDWYFYWSTTPLLTDRHSLLVASGTYVETPGAHRFAPASHTQLLREVSVDGRVLRKCPLDLGWGSFESAVLTHGRLVALTNQGTLVAFDADGAEFAGEGWVSSSGSPTGGMRPR